MDKRTYLVSVFEDTQARIRESAELAVAQAESVAAQRIVLETDHVPLPAPRYADEAKVLVSRRRTFEAAAQYKGAHVCVLNFASFVNPGGGVTHGSSAQEECLCRCSTLYNCLNSPAIWSGFYTPHRHSGKPLYNDDLIFTPGVQVLKADGDYSLLEEPFGVDVITCAAPNLRGPAAGSFNPGGRWTVNIGPEELRLLHERRARKILTVAAESGAEVLVLGAFGCGAFRNNPVAVAQAYKNILPEFAHHFRTIEFAVFCPPHDDSNYRTFESMLGTSDYTRTSDGMYAYAYPRAAVTADSVLFAERDGRTFVLLVRRGNEPYKGCWAFPGGFLNMDETVARCAERELEEETGIVLTGMRLVGVYSDVDRDPRGRVITAAYTAMTDMPEPVAADDAAAAQWWPLGDLPQLAFDHKTILTDAMKMLNISAAHLQ